MALNLGQTLRDAVDGPSLDELVGEDPADLDLPALSARIRHRRRARAATRSAVGVAAAGAVALVGVQGLDRRGVESSGTVPAPGEVLQQLCGVDITRVARLDGPRLAQAGAPVVVDAAGGAAVDGAVSQLGTFVGRTLTAIAVGPTDAAPGELTLTRNGTVVAVGTARIGASVLSAAGSAGQTASVVSSDLAPCPTPAGTPTRVPAGTYSVQYVWDRAAGGGLVRSSAGSWTVTLLDQPGGVTLPAAFPSDEVPVVTGRLVSVTSNTSSDDGSTTAWTVQVGVAGDDGATRAAAALRAAGATVADPLGFVASGGSTAGTADASPAPGTPPTAAGYASLAELAALQARRASAQAAVAAAQGTYDSLVAAQASPDALQWAARTLQAARTEVTSLDGQIAEAEANLSTATIQADLAELQAQQRAQQALASAAATPGPLDGSQAVYTLAGLDGFTAVTHSWTVRVTLDGQTADHLTVLTYALTHS
ncbi:MAG: hypothetical protein BGO37_07470 [Cellulomonas sp. 73-92]|uniref:hypothetical protein n=1 Tax=Cellulomonas sp. 73-92 TaxID=1895740 RepID=UPI0009259D22|nr:hypothetical protein [Cellulomonas sp. 73-92]OJV78542.1 MAG: hypothetical protein BGO37_07470 [Cellulomonas sp. 73-92]